MKSVLDDTKLSNRDDFIQSLVDLFYRCNKNSGHTIKFEDLTSYLIEHEIQQFTSQATSMNTNYTENTDIVDKISHNSNIEKIFYFEEIDKVLLYAQGQEIIRIYDASKMKQDVKDATITCPSKILAIEYIPDKKAIAVSLSDRSILFYDASNKFKIMQKRLNVPSTQKCLAYIQRKSCLFSAGIDGAIFAWNLTKLFSNEQNRHDSYSYTNENTSKDKQAEALRHKKKTEYISYIAEKTPWFVGDTIQCILDLENINQLASGDHGYKIRLWDLRSNQLDTTDLGIEGGESTFNATKKSKKDKVELEKAKKKKEIFKEFFKD